MYNFEECMINGNDYKKRHHQCVNYLYEGKTNYNYWMPKGNGSLQLKMCTFNARRFK